MEYFFRLISRVFIQFMMMSAILIAQFVPAAEIRQRSHNYLLSVGQLKTSSRRKKKLNSFAEKCLFGS